MPRESSTPAVPTACAAPEHPAAFRALLDKRRVLMLQGPMGRFFSDLAGVLLARGQQVTKVHFNGGDQFYWRQPGGLAYNGDPHQLGDWLGRLIREHDFDAIVLFGQMRPIHCQARAKARELGVEVFVFEEGYLRPDWVTIERRGVNALSRQPRLASFYRSQPDAAVPTPVPTRQKLWRTARIAAIYGLASLVLKSVYSRQIHHRSLHPLVEPARWLRGWCRQFLYRWRERHALAPLVSDAAHKRWFLVPLQVQDDSQIRDHSPFDGMVSFMAEVVASFAAHAPADTQLVVKHHPMDRAYTDYTGCLRDLAARHGVSGRVHYLHDQHLPTLLQHARGVVTVNSTVGLQALYHGTPVITLGESVYQIPGLVFAGTLADFWAAPGEVDRALVQRFRAHLVASTQLNASFYADSPALRAVPSRVPAPQPDATDKDLESYVGAAALWPGVKVG